MTLRPCILCGEPVEGPRCAEHTVHTKASARARGYDAAWDRLSKRARRLQPWCTDCGATDDLQCDHLPSAWERAEAGKAVRLVDVEVVCGPCNRRRGASRGNAVTRGDAPGGGLPDPGGRQSSSYTPELVR